MGPFRVYGALYTGFRKELFVFMNSIRRLTFVSETEYFLRKEIKSYVMLF
jgi:hypothetical protein